MQGYLSNLLKQFKASTGIKNIDVNSVEFMKEFREWIESRQSVMENYALLINSMNLNPSVESNGIEIGKGKFDSLAELFDIPMITPYSEGIKRENESLYTGDFFVFDGIPTVITHKSGKNKIEPMDVYDARFMTQNPYEIGNIENWEQLQTKGYDLTVGVFGSIYDKDRGSKLKQLYELGDKMPDVYIGEYDLTDGDIYLGVVSTTRLAKIKRLYKTR